MLLFFRLFSLASMCSFADHFLYANHQHVVCNVGSQQIRPLTYRPVEYRRHHHHHLHLPAPLYFSSPSTQGHAGWPLWRLSSSGWGTFSLQPLGPAAEFSRGGGPGWLQLVSAWQHCPVDWSRRGRLRRRHQGVPGPVSWNAAVQPCRLQTVRPGWMKLRIPRMCFIMWYLLMLVKHYTVFANVGRLAAGLMYTVWFSVLVNVVRKYFATKSPRWKPQRWLTHNTEFSQK